MESNNIGFLLRKDYPNSCIILRVYDDEWKLEKDIKCVRIPRDDEDAIINIQDKLYKRIIMGVNQFDFWHGPLSYDGVDEEDDLSCFTGKNVSTNILDRAIEKLEKE